MKLTANQRQTLIKMRAAGRWFPGPAGASTARSLTDRGLAAKVAEFGPYVITDAGRAALEQGDA